jgi:hypothetical protein
MKKYTKFILIILFVMFVYILWNLFAPMCKSITDSEYRDCDCSGLEVQAIATSAGAEHSVCMGVVTEIKTARLLPQI